MTNRYFIPVDVRDRLVRVDLDPQHHIAQRLDPDGWVDVLSLFGIVLTGDNLEWEEVTLGIAEQVAQRMGASLWR